MKYFECGDALSCLLWLSQLILTARFFFCSSSTKQQWIKGKRCQFLTSFVSLQCGYYIQINNVALPLACSHSYLLICWQNPLDVVTFCWRLDCGATTDYTPTFFVCPPPKTQKSIEVWQRETITTITVSRLPLNYTTTLPLCSTISCYLACLYGDKDISGIRWCIIQQLFSWSIKPFSHRSRTTRLLLFCLAQRMTLGGSLWQLTYWQTVMCKYIVLDSSYLYILWPITVCSYYMP